MNPLNGIIMGVSLVLFMAAFFGSIVFAFFIASKVFDEGTMKHFMAGMTIWLLLIGFVIGTIAPALKGV